MDREDYPSTWLFNMQAVKSAQGWRHPVTNELLKSQKGLLDSVPTVRTGTLFLENFTDTGTAGDYITYDKDFTLALKGAYDGTVTFQKSTNSGSTWATTTPLQASLADGAYQYRGQFVYKGRTVNGNVVSVTVNSVAPTAGTLSLLNFDDTQTAGDYITTDNTFTLTTTGTGTGTKVYQYTKNNSSTWIETVAAQSALSTGVYKFRAKVTSTSGIVSYTNTVQVDIRPIVQLVSATGRLVLINDVNDNGVINVNDTFRVALTCVPGNATETGYTVTVADTNIVTYNSGTGVFTGAANGTTTITLEFTNTAVADVVLTAHVVGVSA